MADNKIRMPSSGAGLTNFYEESKSKIVISPYTVIGISLVVIIITVLLNSTV
ncbi:MAG: preprotein translocase subunit Sec61beta [Candidatus Woesearchaeota archaeon]